MSDIFSETALDLRGSDIAEIEEIMFVFTISLLGTTIQDSVCVMVATKHKVQ